jgi:hypothetical protein
MDLSAGSDAAAMAWIQQRTLIQDSCVPTLRRAEGRWASIRACSMAGQGLGGSSSVPQQGGAAVIPLRLAKYRSRRAAHKRCAVYTLENPP